MEHTFVYIRMKPKITVKKNQKLYLKDIAHVSTTKGIQKELENIHLYTIQEKDKEFVVLDCFQILLALRKRYSSIDFQQLGVTETIIQIKHEKKHQMYLRLFIAWLILFIGTAMTIVNFHDDVNMQLVHQKLHLFLTGNYTEYPLWIQIPYSIGLGLGMILFLNHWFKKRINEEPSPLEVELFTYQKNLDQYIAYYENRLNQKNDST